jgi:hypothetical protein
MNPMAYRGPGQTLVGYEPPPAWSPPTPEQESLREPWIDPTTAFAGGFGANIMRRGLMGALRGGTAAAVADYPLGLATAGVENIDPRLAMPFNLIGGMASGASFERGLENAMAGKAHPVRTARRALGNAMGQVDVWHGSPHSFDRFSMDKIGTGEGAQAFGHGLYFTDLVDVAKHYAKMGDRMPPQLKGDRLEIIDAVAEDTGINPVELQQTLRMFGFRPGNDTSLAHALKNAAGSSGHFRNVDIDKYIKKPTKSLYKATLHKGKDPSEYVYLDWDKPVGQRRADKIIKQAEKEGLDEDDIFDLKEALGTQDSNYPGEPETGESLYSLIADTFAVRTGENLHGKQGKSFNSQKEASLFLKRAGIDGIRYPSGSLSGGSGQGKNYVVFDENAITIEERKALGR